MTEGDGDRRKITFGDGGGPRHQHRRLQEAGPKGERSSKKKY